MNTDFENAFQNEPVTFLLSNALCHLTQDQQRQLCNALLERLPVPASIEDEAARLYPDTKENETVSMGHNGIQDLRRSAHISAARQYMGEISRLKTLLKNTVTPNCECEECARLWQEFKEKHNL